MRSIVLLLIALFCALSTAPVNADSAKTRAFVNVHVVPMDEETVLRDRSVVIEDGRITAIHEADSWQPDGDMTVIDGGGGYLLPGLAEMHAHVPGEDTPMQLREDILFLYLANGVTLARGMLGEPWHLELREALAAGEMTGPRLVTSGPSLNGNTVDSPEQGARKVREQAEAGYDFIKLHPGLTREQFDAIARTAEEVGIDFAGHVSRDVGIDRALEAGYATIDHLDRYLYGLVTEETQETVEPGFFDYKFAPHADRERIDGLAERTREAGVWNVATESLMENYLLTGMDGIRDRRPEFRYVPDEMVDGWIERIEAVRQSEDYDREAAKTFLSVRRDILRALHEAGAGLLLGSDAPQVFNVPGFSIHHELALMESAGLTPYEVLRTGTVNPARFLDRTSERGTVRPGRQADLILVEDNPLESLAALQEPRGVMIRGQWFPREALESRLEAIAERYQSD